MGGGAPRVHGALELLKRATERGIPWNSRRRDKRKAGANQACVAARREERGAETKVGQAIPMGLRDACDESVQSEATQIVGHAACGDRGGILSGEQGKLCFEFPMGKAAWQQTKTDQRIEEPLDAWLAEAER